MVRLRIGKITCLSVISMLLLCSCTFLLSSPPMQQGSYLNKEDYNLITPGASTKSDVMDVLGSPTAYATFDDNTWLYVTLERELVPMSFPNIKKQTVVAVNFDNKNIVQKINVFNKKNGVNVAMVPDKTLTKGTTVNIFQQILGNLGQYSPLTSMLGGNTFGGNGAFGSDNGPGHSGTGNNTL